MNDSEVRLRRVAQLIGTHAALCRANGVSLPATLALAYVEATGGQGRTEVAPVVAPAEAQCMAFSEVAAVLCVSERTVRRMADRGEIPTVDVSSMPRVRVTDLVAYVAALPMRAVA